jgi:hypothetical protein
MIEDEGCIEWEEEELARKVYTAGERTVHDTARSTSR